MLNLPLRLHAHALLRESLVFPGIELCDESPDCSPNGFADIWKGDYHGQSVCIKVIRTQDSTALLKIKSVGGSPLLPETYSPRFILGVPSCNRRGKARSSPERAPRY